MSPKYCDQCGGALNALGRCTAPDGCALKPEDVCGRCGGPLGEPEVCWYCHASLCHQCWEAVGHCGHPEADAENRRARQVPQPPDTTRERFTEYEEPDE